jgi:gliding motility-associated lipoprotein GldH
MRNLIVIALSVILFSACNSGVLIDDRVDIPDHGWQKDNAASFEVKVDDSLALWDVYLNVRNDSEYRWRNAYFFLQTQFPNQQYSRDTLEIQLADHRGKWLGNGVGSLKDNQILLRRGIRFPEKGIYNFEIFHAMRVDTLHGIHDIGIQIKKSQPE